MREEKWNLPNPNLITFPALNNFPSNFIFFHLLKHQRCTSRTRSSAALFTMAPTTIYTTTPSYAATIQNATMLTAKSPMVTVTTLRVLSTSTPTLLATTPLRAVRKTTAPFPLRASYSGHQNHSFLLSQPPSMSEQSHYDSLFSRARTSLLQLDPKLLQHQLKLPPTFPTM